MFEFAKKLEYHEPALFTNERLLLISNANGLLEYLVKLHDLG